MRRTPMPPRASGLARGGFQPRTSGLAAGNGKRAGTGSGGGIAGSGTRGGTGRRPRGSGTDSGAGAGLPGNGARQSRKRPQANPDPGFPPEVKALIRLRDGGCVLRGNAAWGDCWGPVDAHHRRLIGSGGSTAPETHAAPNGIELCRGHHDYVHRYRLRSEAFGLIISRYRNPEKALISFDNGRAWWGLTSGGHCLPAAPCHDCGDLDRAGEDPHEWYMIHDKLWAESGLGPDGGHLCVGCLEKRLGRQLAPADFKDVPLSHPPFGNLTVRLLDRLGYGGDAA